MISPATFTAFCNENQAVVDPQNIPERGPNWNQFEEWKQQFYDTIQDQYQNDLLTEELFDQLISFINNFEIEYISFDAFSKRVEAITKALVKEMLIDWYPTVVLLLITHPIQKSTLWVTMLAWKILQQHINDEEIDFYIVSTFELDWVEKRLKGRKDQRLLTILYDDATYSGQQYSVETAKYQVPNFVPFKTVVGEWYHAVMIPYVTLQAKERIRNTERFGGPKLWFPPGMRIMSILEGPANKYAPMDSVYNIMFDHASIFNRAMTYFQHKFADYASIYHNIIRFAPLPRINHGYKGNTYDGLRQLGPSFIEGCQPDYQVTDTGFITMLIESPDKGALDPFYPIYKTHSWTWQGVPLPKHELLNLAPSP